jgi:lipopolysaccharide transport system permease protein
MTSELGLHAEGRARGAGAARRVDGAHVAETVIRPAHAALGLDLRELWQYRHLFVALVWRNVRVEFDAQRLGFVWAFMRPFMYVVVFALFRSLSGANVGVEIPYPLYVYSGFILWYYFLDAATSSASAVRADAALLTKVYYPRLLTPLVPIVAGLASLAISLAPLAAMMAWYGVAPGPRLLLLPLVLLQCVALTMGIGALIASISVETRDWVRILQFALYLGVYVSPVIYAPGIIPEQFRAVYELNPMVGTLQAFRSALFADVPFPTGQWLYALACSCAALALGVWAFRRAEVRFADRL